MLKVVGVEDPFDETQDNDSTILRLPIMTLEFFIFIHLIVRDNSNKPLFTKKELKQYQTWSFGFLLALWTLCAAASGLSLLVPKVWSSRFVFPKQPTKHCPVEPDPDPDWVPIAWLWVFSPSNLGYEIH